jgi:hypothetical protein
VLNWQVPTVLIEEAETSQAAERSGLIRIKRPIGKDSLRLALAQCLAGAAASQSASAPALAVAPKQARPKESVKPQKPKSAPPLMIDKKPDLIELVDVIEEPE